MDSKKLKKFIVIVLVAILAIVGLLLSITNNIKESNKKSEEEKSKEIIVVEEVDNANLFYTVCDCIDKYLVAIYQKDDAVFDYLDEDYKNQNSIEKDNALEKLDKYDKWCKFDCKSMSMKIYQDYYRFWVNGNVIDANSKKTMKDNVNIIVNLDMGLRTFSLIPNSNDTQADITNKQIALNENNAYDYKIINVNTIIRKYVSEFQTNLNNNVKSAYEMLDEKYREARFKKYEDFEKYVKNYKSEILNITSFEYAIEKKDGYTEYTVRDKNKNCYLIDEYGINDFKIKLDSYTILDEEWKAKYNRVDNSIKVGMNIEIFFEMLNKRDYEKAYGYLSEGFKKNYFKKEKDFEDYIKKNWPKFMDVKYIDITNTGDIYFYNIDIKEVNGKKSVKNKIIMKLTEEGFEMSFDKGK